MKPIRIVDSHIHLGPSSSDVYAHGWELKEVLRLADRLGIDRLYSMHIYWIKGRFAEAREESMNAYDESSGRVPFLGVYDPRNEKLSLKTLDSCVGHEGFIGVKIQPSWHHTPADDKSYEAAWRFAEEHHLPILSHTWSNSDYNPVQRLATPGLFETYVDKYSSVSFVLGHSGGRGTGQIEAINLVKKYPNTFLDIAGDIFCLDLISRFSQAVGPERILYASDMPWFDPRANLLRVVLADIDSKAKQLILRDNALRIFEPELLERCTSAQNDQKLGSVIPAYR